MSIDTLKVARRLREAGFTEPQFGTELRAEIAALRAEITAEFAAIRAEMREMEQRLITRIETVKGELIGKMFSMVVGAVLVNIVAMLGAMFAFAKLLGH